MIRTLLIFQTARPNVFIRAGKNKRCIVTIKILFVSWIVLGICWYFNLGFTLVTVSVQIVTTAQNKSQH